MSFVLVSPSTESWFQVRTVATRSRPWRVAGLTAASVRTIASMVAIRGWIMPTPLAMPATVTVTGVPSGAGSSSRVEAILATESVVRRASATAANAASSVERPLPARVATPATTFSTGSRVPMRPVERLRTLAWSTWRLAATA